MAALANWQTERLATPILPATCLRMAIFGCPTARIPFIPFVLLAISRSPSGTTTAYTSGNCTLVVSTKIQYEPLWSPVWAAAAEDRLWDMAAEAADGDVATIRGKAEEDSHGLRENRRSFDDGFDSHIETDPIFWSAETDEGNAVSILAQHGWDEDRVRQELTLAISEEGEDLVRILLEDLITRAREESGEDTERSSEEGSPPSRGSMPI